MLFPLPGNDEMQLYKNMIEALFGESQPPKQLRNAEFGMGNERKKEEKGDSPHVNADCGLKRKPKKSDCRMNKSFRNLGSSSNSLIEYFTKTCQGPGRKARLRSKHRREIRFL